MLRHEKFHTDTYDPNYDPYNPVGFTDSRNTAALVFSGGTSVQEYTLGDPADAIANAQPVAVSGATPLAAEFIRGSDMGGGVGGILYSLRQVSGAVRYPAYNHRGDTVALADGGGANG